MEQRRKPKKTAVGGIRSLIQCLRYIIFLEMGNLNNKNLLKFKEEETNETNPEQHFLVSGVFLVKKKIGSGSFGRIHRCVKISNNEVFAVKFETERQVGQLEYENKIYQFLKGHVGISNIQNFGKDKYEHFLIMDYLGPNLESLFKYCGRKFSLKTVLMIADQILCRLQLVHTKSFVYRDIKPENFVIGRGENKNQIHIIDFGLSKLYREFWTHKLNKYRNKRDLVGTVRYSSVNTHLGIEQSRRDDLESLGYMLIYFLKGRLPWQGIVASNKKKRNKKICDKKIVTPLSVLCEGLPVEFQQYIEYCKNLSFEGEPNYSFLRKKFRQLFLLNGYVYDYQYDWKIKHDKESQMRQDMPTDQEFFNGKQVNVDINQTKIISNQRKERKKTTHNYKNLNTKSNKRHYNNTNQEKQKSKTKSKTKSNKKNKNKKNNNKKKIRGIVLIEETESESESTLENELEMEKKRKKEKERKKNKQKSKKLKEMNERIEFYNKKQNKKFKLKIENYLLRKQKTPKMDELKKETLSHFFLRIGEKYSLKRREMYKDIKNVEEILKNNTGFKDYRIPELINSLKLELNGSLTFNSFLFLENDLLNLLYIVNEKKKELELNYNSKNLKYNNNNDDDDDEEEDDDDESDNDDDDEMMITTRNDFDGKKKKKEKKKNKKKKKKLTRKEKRKFKKIWLFERLEKKKILLDEKYNILEKALQIRAIREDDFIFDLYQKISPLSTKNLSYKKLDNMCNKIEKILVLSKEKID
ncbi:casein kinase 1-like protein [Anaeramoeba flamelloides]|uniref:non-specific serine/threonine protein kinase n=1 Tax=Anaeramoeba flamelloides TaxID=1746091 RepID=A0AAV7YBV0_9EUKA|nr:casein kinase 1-like protein [Anaeramoeba flamelloides]